MSAIRTVSLAGVSFDPGGVLAALAQARVEFIVVGGVAATLHGSPVATADVDAVVERSAANRGRLANALTTLEAAVLVSVDVTSGTATVVDQQIDATLLDLLDPARLLTRHGVLDVMWRDQTVGDHSAWAEHAVPVHLDDGVEILVAAVEDLISSKQRADRDRDRAALPFLHAILDRQHGAS